MEKTEKICPPRLNAPYILMFYTVSELMVMSALFILGVLTSTKPPIFVMAMVAIFQLRPCDDLPNLSSYCRKCLRFFTSSQSFTTDDNGGKYR